MTEEIKQNNDESVPVEQIVIEETSVGEVLRAAREAAGLRLDDIAERFKLRVAQVQAVEANEWEKLPSRTFARGLVRGYARELRLDAEALVNRVMQEAKVEETPIVPPSTQNLQPAQPSSETPRRDLGMVVVGVVILLVAILAYFLWPASPDKVDQGPVLPPPSTEAPAAPVPVVPAQALPVPAGSASGQPLAPNVVSLSAPAPTVAPTPLTPVAGAPAAVAAAPAPVTVPAPVVPQTGLIKISFTAPSWVEIKDKNGNVVFSQTGHAGLEKEVSGQGPFSFHIGNASGVKVVYKGQAVDLRPSTSNNVSRLKLD